MLVRPVRPVPAPTERRLIVGDVHGDHRSVQELLLALGVLDADGRRSPGWWVCQIGDLIHGASSTAESDLRTLRACASWFDLVLAGNHEVLQLTGHPSGDFNGVRRVPGPEMRLALDAYWEAGHFDVATHVDGWLVTHAGVHPHYQRLLGGNAERLSATLNHLFDALPGHPVFGIRPHGAQPMGKVFTPTGCLCTEFTTLAAAPRHRLRQIVGHTPQASGRPEYRDVDRQAGATDDRPGPADGTGLWCVDVGAALTGMAAGVMMLPGGPWQPVTCERFGARRRTPAEVARGSYGEPSSGTSWGARPFRPEIGLPGGYRGGERQGSFWPPTPRATPSATAPTDDDLVFTVLATDVGELCSVAEAIGIAGIDEVICMVENDDERLGEEIEDALVTEAGGRRAWLLSALGPHLVDAVLDGTGEPGWEPDGEPEVVVCALTRADIALAMGDAADALDATSDEELELVCRQAGIQWSLERSTEWEGALEGAVIGLLSDGFEPPRDRHATH